ncbi:hypothetical protein F511_28294 [Dorcoceras hygrometricum]|uniref:Uncharacterized protein n=1 Tax=Dorcoceras hygrometricum TaxID=472368 RepID=A0A2Z7A4K5_9LAMI|nr:hypothetical protein F511_28294 [Dorcoceras hygrometricum]
MVPKRIVRLVKHVAKKSGAQNREDDIVQDSLSERKCVRSVEDDVVHQAHQVDEMELVLARFHRMNPPTLTDA